MKTLILLLSLFFLSFTNISNKKEELAENNVCLVTKYNNSLELDDLNETTVMLCTGKYSKKYHTSPPSSKCKGMKACKGDKKKVSLSEAKKMGLTACGYCYK